MDQSFLGDIYALLTAVSWAFTIILLRLSGFHFKPIPLKVFQNFCALVLFLISAIIFGEMHFPNLKGDQWWLLVGSAILGVTLGDTFHVASLNRIGAGLQAIVDCLYVPIVMVFSYMFFAEIMGPTELIGGGLVILGISIGSSGGSLPGIESKELWIGLTYGLLAQFSHAGTVLMVKELVEYESVLNLTLYRFAIGLFFLVIWYVIRGEYGFILQAFRFDSRLKWTLSSTVLGPFASTLFWFLSFKYTLAGRAAIYNQMASIFIIILAVVWLKEPLKRRNWLAISIAIAGGLLVALG